MSRPMASWSPSTGSSSSSRIAPSEPSEAAAAATAPSHQVTEKHACEETGTGASRSALAAATANDAKKHKEDDDDEYDAQHAAGAVLRWRERRVYRRLSRGGRQGNALRFGDA